MVLATSRPLSTLSTAAKKHQTEASACRSISRAKLMGTVLVLSLLATFLIERQALTSVWCFFAAILSVLIVLSISKDHHLIIEPA